MRNSKSDRISEYKIKTGHYIVKGDDAKNYFIYCNVIYYTILISRSTL